MARLYRATDTLSTLLLQGVWPWRGRAVVCFRLVIKILVFPLGRHHLNECHPHASDC